MHGEFILLLIIAKGKVEQVDTRKKRRGEKKREREVGRGEGRGGMKRGSWEALR